MSTGIEPPGVLPPTGWIDRLVVLVRRPVLAFCLLAAFARPFIVLGWVPEVIVLPVLITLAVMTVLLLALSISPRSLLINNHDLNSMAGSYGALPPLTFRRGLRYLRSMIDGQAPADSAAVTTGLLCMLSVFMQEMLLPQDDRILLMTIASCFPAIMLAKLFDRRVPPEVYQAWRRSLQ